MTTLSNNKKEGKTSHSLLEVSPWILGFTSIILSGIVPHYYPMLSLTGVILAIGGIVIEKKIKRKNRKVITLCTIGLIMSSIMFLYNSMIAV